MTRGGNSTGTSATCLSVYRRDEAGLESLRSGCRLLNLSEVTSGSGKHRASLGDGDLSSRRDVGALSSGRKGGMRTCVGSRCHSCPVQINSDGPRQPAVPWMRNSVGGGVFPRLAGTQH